MASLFLNQIWTLPLHLLSALQHQPQLTTHSFLKHSLLLALVILPSPDFPSTSLALPIFFQTLWPLTSLYLLSKYVNHVHGTKFRRYYKAHKKQ